MSTPPPVTPAAAPETTIPIPEISMPEIDWASVGLGLLALIAVGGLIPFWIYIFFLYNPR
jgi:serine/threonine-protein kinase